MRASRSSARDMPSPRKAQASRTWRTPTEEEHSPQFEHRVLAGKAEGHGPVMGMLLLSVALATPEPTSRATAPRLRICADHRGSATHTSRYPSATRANHLATRSAV
eukprot:scaffold93601_cov32-Tisochrysis_lutea.AAC.5